MGIPEHQPYSTRSSGPVSRCSHPRDAPLGAPAPSPARFLRVCPNEISQTSASFDPQFPGRAPRFSHPCQAPLGAPAPPRRQGFSGCVPMRLPEHQPHSTRSSRVVHHDSAIHVRPPWERRRPRRQGFSRCVSMRLPEHQPRTRAWPGKCHDAAIHVRPTLGAPTPSPAGFLTMCPYKISRTSASFDPQLPGRAPRCSHPREAHPGSAGTLAGRVSQGVSQ